jgi:DNA-binding transcriptional LysR family regulator
LVNNLTLKQLRAFAAVAEENSFTVAAVRLHLSQSAVSLLIRELEEELGLKLLERTTRQVKLAPAGIDFYPHAERVLRDVDTATASAEHLRERKRGKVRIAATGLYAATLVPQALVVFQHEYPGIEVRIIDQLNEQVLASVLSETVDIGVAPQQRPPSAEIEQTALLLDRLYLICPMNHELSSRTSVTWKEALRFPFVTASHDYTVRLQMDLNSHSPDLVVNSLQQVSYFSTVLGMIKAGLGITALPAHTLPFTKAYGLTGIPLREPVVKRQVSLFTKKGQTLSPAAEAMVSFLHGFVKRGP